MSPSLSDLNGHLVTEIKGVTPAKAAALRQVEVETVLDLLTYYPRRWIDRTNQKTIAELVPDEVVYLLVRVKRTSSRRVRGGRIAAEVVVADDSGRSLSVTFWNQPWITRKLEVDDEVILYGKTAVYRGRLTLQSPSIDEVGDQTGRIVSLYPESEKAGLRTRDIASWVASALRRAVQIDDPLPDEWRDRLDLQSRKWAFNNIHQPDSIGAKNAARKRLAFDELLRMQLLLVQRKRRMELESIGIRHELDGVLVDRFVDALPFPLTGAQRRAIAEVAADLAGPHPMHRLLQGDVGAGKTLVAVAALLTSVQGGHQGALLAPTEVLAEQHDAVVRDLVAGLPVKSDNLFGARDVRVELLTGRTGAADRTRIANGLAMGDVDILIGTHALLTEAVTFRDLGVVVVDEQHRFGVEQRAVLRDKGADGVVPDVLVMTATPIPRTAAMTVYGDLDVTTLDEMPPGRAPIKTTWAQGPLAEAAAWDTARREIAAGHQVYVVCPLVEESERVQSRAATAEYERLAATELKDVRLGLLHGQMPPKEKEAAMDLFRRGDTDALVATTVIEVGVDVPNASVMIVLDADRFGIAQLHQLRGRVGRGNVPSWCFLLGEAITEGGEQRLKAMERTTDGFELAEVDLELRGEGTIMGIRQKGRNDLKLASLARDRPLVEQARRVAFDLVGDGTGLSRYPLYEGELRDLVDDEEAEYLFKS